MTFAGAIKTCFTKYADFRGTAARPEYWYFVLFTILVSIVLSTVDSIVFPADPDANLLASSMRKPIQRCGQPANAAANPCRFG
jgi:hypothetical protein